MTGTGSGEALFITKLSVKLAFAVWSRKRVAGPGPLTFALARKMPVSALARDEPSALLACRSNGAAEPSDTSIGRDELPSELVTS